MRSRLITIVALVGLVTPIAGIAQSYLTPEQVLQQNDGAFLIPSHHRGAVMITDLQAQQSLDRHPTIFRDASDPVVDNGLPPVIENGGAPTPVVDLGIPNPYGGLDPVTARLLARLAQQNSLLESQMFGAGRPLAQTGPASVLVVVAMAVATLWTLRRARVLERFVKEL